MQSKKIIMDNDTMQSKEIETIKIYIERSKKIILFDKFL